MEKNRLTRRCLSYAAALRVQKAWFDSRAEARGNHRSSVTIFDRSPLGLFLLFPVHAHDFSLRFEPI